MKKTNNTGYIFLVILAVAVVITALIATLETIFGVADVFLGAVILIPATLIWCLLTSNNNLPHKHNKNNHYDNNY